ncbi:MAG: HDOD domain-containing protein [Methylomonas sp.]|jgi:HD-like signal output (HDOD) protein
MTNKLEQLLNQIHNLPQIPEVVRNIINLLNDPYSEVLDIVKNVEKEQVIALKILRLVNSAHFGLSRKVSSIEEATMMIGLSQLKLLVIASGIVHAIPRIPHFDIRAFWKQSFLTASIAKWFADKAGLPAEVAYTAGLFSGLGNILIHIGSPRDANEIDQHVKAGGFRPDLERNRLGFTNQAACGELLRRWKLADELINAIKNSAEPLSEIPADKLACAVYVGGYISQCVAHGASHEHILDKFPYAVAEQIGFNADAIEESLHHVLGAHFNLDELID